MTESTYTELDKVDKMIRINFWYHWDLLCAASVAYYELDDPFMSDDENDFLCKKVRQLYAENKHVFVGWLGHPPRAWIKEWLEAETYATTFHFVYNLELPVYDAYIKILRAGVK